MSRASEITLFLVLLQAAIGFVDATGMFTEQYLDVPVNNASYTLDDLEDYAEAGNEKQSITDELTLLAYMAWDAFFIGLKVILTVLFVLPSLVFTFGVEPILATFIQVGIYYVYGTWYAQYRSGRGWKQYE